MTIPEPLLKAALQSRLLLKTNGVMSGKGLVQALMTSQPLWTRSFLRTRVVPFLKQYDYIRSVYTRPTKEGQPATWKWQLNAGRPLHEQHMAYLVPSPLSSKPLSGSGSGSDVMPVPVTPQREIDAAWKAYWITGVDDQPLPTPPPRLPRYPGLHKTTRCMSRKLRHKLKTINRAMIKKMKEQRRKVKRRAKKLAKYARASSVQRNTKKFQSLKKFAQAHAAAKRARSGALSTESSLGPSSPLTK